MQSFFLFLCTYIYWTGTNFLLTLGVRIRQILFDLICEYCLNECLCVPYSYFTKKGTVLSLLAKFKGNC